jgi:hypothetical protein
MHFILSTGMTIRWSGYILKVHRPPNESAAVDLYWSYRGKYHTQNYYFRGNEKHYADTVNEPAAACDESYEDTLR